MSKPVTLATQFQRGFTLIELMIAIAIIGILAGIALPFYGDYVNRARAAAFLVQVDGWREKLAIECASNEGIPSDLQKRVLGFTTPSPLTLHDYLLDLFWEVKSTGAGEKRFILVAMASAGKSATALKVAPFIRRELDHAGLHYTEYQDVVLPSIQLFAVNLGSCGEIGSSTVKPGLPQPSGVPQAPAVPQPPAVIPAQNAVVQDKSVPPQPPAASNTGNSGGAGQGSASGSSAGSSTSNSPPQPQQPVTCAANQMLSADGKTCVTRPAQSTSQSSCAGHINPQGRCVGIGNGSSNKNH